VSSTKTSEALIRKRIYTTNNRPVHVHTCTSGDHTWECDSPYCEVMQADCPEHGGFEPVQIGREPWRGR
jgi:hypothetical protein